jgi:hypothetical protein
MAIHFQRAPRQRARPRMFADRLAEGREQKLAVRRVGACWASAREHPRDRVRCVRVISQPGQERCARGDVAFAADPGTSANAVYGPACSLLCCSRCANKRQSEMRRSALPATPNAHAHLRSCARAGRDRWLITACSGKVVQAKRSVAHTGDEARGGKHHQCRFAASTRWL